MEWVYSTYSQHEKSQLRLALGNCKLNIKTLSKNMDTAITPLRNFNGQVPLENYLCFWASLLHTTSLCGIQGSDGSPSKVIQPTSSAV